MYAPRRTLLDPLLADAARASGAEIAYRVRLNGLQHDGRGRVTGAVLESGGRARSISAGIVIGADGANSTVAKRAGAETYWVGANRSATIYTRIRGLPMSGYHWHYVPGASVGLIPTNDGETLVFVAAAGRRFMGELRFDLAAGFATIVREAAPPVAAAISAAPVARYHGFAGRCGFLRRAWGPGWALVGDAGYFKDPDHGARHHRCAARRRGSREGSPSGTDAALASYQAIRDALSMRLFTITDEIASFDWDLPRLQTLHKALSDEMAREVSHVIDGPTAGEAFGDADGGTRPHVHPDHGRLQPATC